MSKDRLVTPSYCLILAANFLLYFGFWLLIPVLPFYLNEVFQVAEATPPSASYFPATPLQPFASVRSLDICSTHLRASLFTCSPTLFSC